MVNKDLEREWWLVLNYGGTVPAREIPPTIAKSWHMNTRYALVRQQGTVV